MPDTTDKPKNEAQRLGDDSFIEPLPSDCRMTDIKSKSRRKKIVKLSLAESLELGYDSEEEYHWAPNPHQMEADLHVLNGEWAGQEVLQDWQLQDWQLQDWQNSFTSDWHMWLTPGSADDCFAMVPLFVGYSCANVADTDAYNKIDTQVDDHGGDSDTSVPDSEGLEPSSEVEGSSSDLGEATSELEDSPPPENIVVASENNSKNTTTQEDYLRLAGLWRPDLYMNLSHKVVPRNADFTKPEFDRSSSSNGDTTMMLRNLPNEYTRTMLMSVLDEYGFFGKYDFIYLPIDKCTHWNVGYAFVNFLSPEIAERCRCELADHRLPSEDPRPDKVTKVCRAHVQGLEKNVEYYKRAAVMTSRHESHRPLILPGGTREEPSEADRNKA